MLITARSLEGTIINYIYSCSPRKGNLFGGGPITVHYSIWRLQYVIGMNDYIIQNFAKTAYGMILAFVF